MPHPAVLVLLLYALVAGAYYLAAAVLADLGGGDAVRKCLIRPGDVCRFDGGSYLVLSVSGNEVRLVYRRGRVRVPVELDADAWLHLVATHHRPGRWPREGPADGWELGESGA